MNTLLNALRPIMNTKTAKIVLEVAAHPKDENQMVVLARPVVGQVSNKAPQELQVLCANLATPIKVMGTPEDIEAALTNAVTEQASHRTTWGNRAAEIEAQIQAAAQADAKGKTAAKPATKVAASPAATTTTPKVEEKTDEVDLTGTADQDNEEDKETVSSGFSL